MTSKLQLLTGEQRKEIAAAAFQLLERVGVRLTESEARELLHGAGARIDGQRAFLLASLIEEAIHSAPSGTSIYTRDGRLSMRVRSTHRDEGRMLT